MSWNEEHGLQLLIDGVQVDNTTTYQTVTPQQSTDYNVYFARPHHRFDGNSR